MKGKDEVAEREEGGRMNSQRDLGRQLLAGFAMWLQERVRGTYSDDRAGVLAGHFTVVEAGLRRLQDLLEFLCFPSPVGTVVSLSVVL